MVWWQAAGWGLSGGAAAGLVSLMTAVHAAGFSWPWKGDRAQLGPRLFVFAGELLLGALVATVMHGQMTGPWPAFAMGIGAPATVRGLVAGIEVSERKPAQAPAVAASSPAPLSGVREELATGEGGRGDGGR